LANYAYEQAVKHMTTLNIYAASLMKKYKASGSTDITGFGILGHTKNLVLAQKRKVDFVIDYLPVIVGMAKVDKVANYGLLKGISAETSGGLLIIIPK
jgi:selenide,water dikinase